jgi:hypothetical protein
MGFRITVTELLLGVELFRTNSITFPPTRTVECCQYLVQSNRTSILDLNLQDQTDRDNFRLDLVDKLVI